MQLISPAFKNNDFIPKKYTCDGDGIIPPLQIKYPPPDTKSFVLIIDDPDVPTYIRADGNWDHLIIWNIPANTQKIEEGILPQGIIGKNTSNQYNYCPPCPPDKAHRYFFKLYALNIILENIDINITKENLLDMIKNNILEYTELIGIYDRKNKL